jgi:putative colanic acid biosynthesis UDP-glucose lipid carrier transferase
MQFAQTVLDNPQYGYRVLGFLDDSHKDWLNGSYLGSIADLESILKTRRVDDVLIALPNSAHRKIESVVNACKNSTVRVRVVPDMKGLGLGSYDLTTFGGLPIFSFRKNNLNEAHLRMFKRTFDILFSLLVLALVYWWLWPLVILLQKIMDPGPLYYKAKRWGREGREFTCYKFRSMLPNSQNVDLNGNHLHTTTEDPRVTKLGRFLRKLNLDELPQFINVLKGEMSVVGPRPHDAAENIVLREKIRDYMPRHLVKPGVTGWAQVNGLRGGTDDIELMKKRTIYDIWYIENWSMWLDLQIILKTIWLAIKGDPNAY